jgi:16S rRNA (cytosine1402-N4)-methyltransferase
VTSESYGAHIPVLKKECLHFLAPENKGPCWFADLTFGGGGHSLALLEEFPDVRIMAFDQDPEAIANARGLIEEKKLSSRISLEHGNFSGFPTFWKQIAPTLPNARGGLSGILLDLGVSSHLLDNPSRGLSFRFDGPLDMRMNPQADTPTAADLLNSLAEAELADIFYKYGEERFSRKIAANVVKQRKEKYFSTTKELENLVFHSYPASARHSRIHPATRCFQALRIAVNGELTCLEETLPLLPSLLAPGGKLAVISFHSLEDRIAKHVFKKVKIDHPDMFEVLTKKPIVPSEDEIRENLRSRSAKLRVVQRL